MSKLSEPQAIALSKLEGMVPVKHCGKQLSLAGITKQDLQHVALEVGVKDCQQVSAFNYIKITTSTTSKLQACELQVVLLFY